MEGLVLEIGKIGIFIEIGGKEGRIGRDREVWVVGEEMERVFD